MYSKYNLPVIGSLTLLVDWQEACREAEPEPWVSVAPPRERRDSRKSVKLPETPKTAEEMWQHSVMGDYLARFRVGQRSEVSRGTVSSGSSPLTPGFMCPQSDRRKAQTAMEASWKSMEKKEKIPWIKKAAEDQKRYEVLTSDP